MSFGPGLDGITPLTQTDNFGPGMDYIVPFITTKPSMFGPGIDRVASVPPVVTSISPVIGPSIGNTYVTVQGFNFNLVALGQVQVFVGPTLEDAVQIPQDDVFVYTSTLMAFVTQPMPLGTMNVYIVNQTTQPTGPDITDYARNVPTFLSRLPDISTPGTSNFSILTFIIRQLIMDLRQYVLANTWPDMHPEYADAAYAIGLPWPEPKQASFPSLQILGPEVEENRWYALNGFAENGTNLYEEPVCQFLKFDYLGVAETPPEAHWLFEALTRYFHSTPFLNVTLPDGSVQSFEMNPEWTKRASFRQHATRAGLAQFSGSFRIDGVLVKDIDSINVTQIGITPPVTQEVILEIVPFSTPDPNAAYGGV